MYCRILGFIIFWIAVGMLLSIFITDNLFIEVCIIVGLMILGFNMFYR